MVSHRSARSFGRTKLELGRRISRSYHCLNSRLSKFVNIFQTHPRTADIHLSRTVLLKVRFIDEATQAMRVFGGIEAQRDDGCGALQVISARNVTTLRRAVRSDIAHVFPSPRRICRGRPPTVSRAEQGRSVRPIADTARHAEFRDRRCRFRFRRHTGWRRVRSTIAAATRDDREGKPPAWATQSP